MTTASARPCLYHPSVDRILINNLGDRSAVQALRRAAETPGCDPGTELLHAAALRTGEMAKRLDQKLRHAIGDLQAAAIEIADGRAAEHLLTGRSDELLVLAHRHHDAATWLETVARAWARHRIQTPTGNP
ncbi:hypothetical protein ABH935_007032 [Catenulispora sp. GAS73]|uniref:hypothetical protein n=1 Tax=Catenulispora sp. GAS73 TaxID=3156269 RepID=UPI00351488B3